MAHTESEIQALPIMKHSTPTPEQEPMLTPEQLQKNLLAIGSLGAITGRQYVKAVSASHAALLDALRTERDLREKAERERDAKGWPEGLKQGEFYTMESDDDPDEKMRLYIDSQGDAYITCFNLEKSVSVRMCTMQGAGSRHLRTRIAMLYLANAIRLDNEELGRHAQHNTLQPERDNP